MELQSLECQELMTCNSCGCSSCRCGFITQKPYYTDACQESGCLEKIYICNYSTVIRVQGEWAVPVAGEIVTLNVPALTDIMIGSIIANPDYGSYEVVAIPADEQIKVRKTDQNAVAAGTTIPSCTKFMPSLILEESATWNSFDANWEAYSGAGAIASILEQNEYVVDGDRVDITLNNEVEISGAVLAGVTFDLPFQAATFTNMGQKIACTLFLSGTGSFPGTIELLASAAKGLVYRTDGTSLAVGNWVIQQNFFYKKGA